MRETPKDLLTTLLLETVVDTRVNSPGNSKSSRYDPDLISGEMDNPQAYRPKHRTPYKALRSKGKVHGQASTTQCQSTGNEDLTNPIPYIIESTPPRNRYIP